MDGQEERTRAALSDWKGALHLAEVLLMAMEHGPAGPKTTRPEEVFPGQGARVSRVGVAVGVAAALGGAMLAAWALRGRTKTAEIRRLYGVRCGIDFEFGGKSSPTARLASLARAHSWDRGGRSRRPSKLPPQR
jgi:hypothetical protein